MTAKQFGPTSLLTAHRMLRLGVVRFAEGKLSEAAGLLQAAQETLLVRAGSCVCLHTVCARLPGA